MVAEPKTVSRPITYTDLVTQDDERHIELYDGEVHEMTSPTLLHQRIILRFCANLERWIEEHIAGSLYLSPVDLYVTETRCFIPDFCFYRAERFTNEAIERDDGRCLIAPPDLVVEVVSPSTARNDRIFKAAAYAEFGVDRYWIIEPDARTLQAYVLDDKRYAIEAGFTESDTMTSPLFPDWQMPLIQLFNS